MSTSVLATKLYIPSPRPKIVLRSRLIERLIEGLCQNQDLGQNPGFGRKLTIISAPAGFGKTTLVSEWIQAIDNEMSSIAIAWLSLDEEDNDPTRFLTYFVAALRTVMAEVGKKALAALQSPQPPSSESILTELLNEIITIPGNFILILDDYHTIDTKPADALTSVDEAITFLLEHLPPQMHLVIATREDPNLPLPRYRARDQLTELRAADLRFTPSEAAEFLNQVMGLNLSEEDITALETRTEGWIAGLQMAALALQGLVQQEPLSNQDQSESTCFIQAFTGSHHFVLDYLLEEVLDQQPESVQNFLLRTSILDRMCGSLCDAVLLNLSTPRQKITAQDTLEYLERANLFIISLDSERRWYRYHHLFGDLLRQRLGQRLTPETIAEDHIRASEWYETNNLTFEAFRHATVANDITRAERLIESDAMPLHFHSVAMAIVNWLTSLPKAVLNAKPGLWVKSCTLALMAGQTSGVEKRLQAAEEALQGLEPALSTTEGFDDKVRDQIGQIACARATLALTNYQPEEMIVQAHRALECLHPDNLVFRFTAEWALASAYFLQGNRSAAAQASAEGIAISQKSGDIFSTILATANLGQAQELENQLHQAANTYQSLLPLVSEHPQPNAAEIHLGLARIYYQWNDLGAAEEHGQQSLQLSRQYDHVIDRFIISEVFLAYLKLARGDVDSAATMLTQTEQTAQEKNFSLRLPEIAAARVLVMIQQGNLSAAEQLAQQFELPLSQARVLLTQSKPSAALTILETFCQQMETRGWVDEHLRAMVLQAIALRLNGEKDKALDTLAKAISLAEPGGFIRVFVDEGEPMAQLISEGAAQGIMPDYTDKLLAAFKAEPWKNQDKPDLLHTQNLIEPLSQRELEVLQLIAQGLSNREISERLFLALDTIKGHNRRIYDKLQVHRRTEAIARARELGLL